MSIRKVGFIALLFAALALVPAGAHVAELPNKIDLARDEYLTVQQIYRGWALFGIVVFGALASTLTLTIKARRRAPRTFPFALVAFICLIGTQVVFWTVTFPVNQATENWTVLPAHWTELRSQWEYSHATSAALNLCAFIALALAWVDTSDVA
jgi:hypothetical protein